MNATRLLRLLLCLGLVLASSASPVVAEGTAVTAANVLQNERFWPYHAALTKPFSGIQTGTVGVLIRLESATLARIDFGRDGIHEVPIESTDVVERARGIQLG